MPATKDVNSRNNVPSWNLICASSIPRNLISSNTNQSMDQTHGLGMGKRKGAGLENDHFLAHMLRFSTSFFNGKLSFPSDNKGRRTQLLPFASLKRPDNNIVIDPKVDSLLDSVKWDDKGLAVAIARNVDTGAILMQGFANREAVFTTLSSRKATFFSRSRSTLWTKGETSNNHINIHDVFLDCDREEANELCQTLENNEDRLRTASEMADVLYHAMVLLAVKDVKVEDVLQVLRQRFTQFGIEEKKSRVSKKSEQD